MIKTGIRTALRRKGTGYLASPPDARDFVRGVGDADQVAVTARPVGAAEAGVGEADVGAETDDAEGEQGRRDQQCAVQAAGRGGRGAGVQSKFSHGASRRSTNSAANSSDR